MLVVGLARIKWTAMSVAYALLDWMPGVSAAFGASINLLSPVRWEGIGLRLPVADRAQRHNQRIARARDGSPQGRDYRLGLRRPGSGGMRHHSPTTGKVTVSITA